VADGFQATDFSFSLHDGFHGFKDSAVSKEEMWATLKLIELLHTILESQNPKDNDLEQLLFYLKDGDLETNFKGDKSWGKVFDLNQIKLFLKKHYLEEIIKNIVINKTEWERVGITRESLTESQQYIYDHYHLIIYRSF